MSAASKQIASKREEIKQRAMIARFMNVFQEQPERNFSPEEIKQALEVEGGPIETTVLFKFLRHLISNGNVRNIQTEDGRNTYRYVPDELADKFSGLNEEHHRIYSLIEQAGDKGIWRGDIKKKTNLDEKQFVQILNQMKQRELIKEVTSVTDKKKNLFLFEIDPSSEVTGGIWFSGSTFNSELIDQLLPHVVQFVINQPGITVGELKRKIKSSGIGNLRYNDDEAEQLVTATISSGQIFKIGNTLKPGPMQPLACPISKTPCKGCPFLSVCEPGNSINPVDCPYLHKMTEFF
ncbi:RNA polymerase Rpc34 [Histomonas meleagridis]|uniref:RNA polymerase Rpc34 n=1 Tax=Histomonas meleagridis TaxID=135588 RepID=UPI00355A848A|nr:RNA polymerase Rpc34 [Histomonas meleagridis]KAH0801055.1 RNA polymerase Rpc34 [Histomonas meleagridis]